MQKPTELEVFIAVSLQRSDDCERIPIDPEDSRPGQGLDHRENQWMAVHVKSQGPGGKVVVCAHRYQQWIRDNQLVLGRCFILKQNLTVEDTRTFCRNRGSSKEMLGYCQQGVSAAFTKDNNYIMFSGPGAYDWRGFALDLGTNLLQKDKQVILAGAPCSNLSGEVLILKPDENQRSLIIAHILHGPGLASSFDYSLSVMDLNADGWEAGIGGAVYVYINRQNGRDWDQLQPDILTGNKDSMFGLAVAKTGDINHDGYNDFAVGAPYDNDGYGAVYINFGKTSHFSQKDYQVLRGEAHNIKFFGYSLAGNMDIDGNGYPDLAVGSLSDSVLIYRAKPVISIEKSLTLTPNEMNFQERDCQKGHCIITAESCFSYTTYPETYNPKLKILYKLNADEQWGQEGQLSRLVFQSNHEGNIVLAKQGEKRCVQRRLRLRADTKNKLTEIPVSVSVSLPPQTLSRSSLPILQPALNNLQPRKITAKLMFFDPDCGSDNICQSNLQLQYSFCSKDQHLDFCSPLAREDGVAVIFPGSENTALKITVTNPGGDDAHLVQLVANFPESLPLSSVFHKPDSNVNVQCDVDESKTRAECNLGNPFKRNAEISNMGRPLKSFASVTLNIWWPKENKEFKWLLYLLRITGPNNQSIPCSPASEISPLKHAQETCDNELKCVELKCPLRAADKTTVILHSRLWSSTFVEVNFDCFLFLCMEAGALGGEFSIRLPERVEALSGLCVHIPCSFDTKEYFDKDLNEVPTGIWLKDGIDMEINTVFNSKTPEENKFQGEMIGNLSMKNCTTAFNNIKLWDSGDFYFKIKTLWPLEFTYTTPVFMNVQDAPRVSFSNYSCNNTQDLIVCSCEIDGNPAPTLEWHLSGQNTSSTRNEAVTNTTIRSFISIPNSFKDILILQCIGSNKVGNDKQIRYFKPQDAAEGGNVSSALIGVAVGAIVFLMLAGAFLYVRRVYLLQNGRGNKDVINFSDIVSVKSNLQI
ncbi:Integrin alpha-6 [Bagarius yarrelli]|uniref:Integrin alpha-6 n=1 Tax=Bagarius yarrelli TaxID=175774 RepID=A0A556U1U5_BAGYA|nr:Integrin alpha-6 [Bagarius yarrelli]